MGFIRKKISLKVALLVNFILLLLIVGGTYFLVTKQNANLEEQLIRRGRTESIIGAKMIGQVFEQAITSKQLTLQDVFDQEYVPIPGYDPPKFSTRYDGFLDKNILELQDEFLIDESVVFAVAVDINGYLPTHNTRFTQPLTGDKEKDLKLNRTKRIFNDETGMNAAKNTEKGFMQVYERDTEEIMYDFSSPVYVQGKHWGGFRIGFSLKKINEAKKQQMNMLIMIMAGIFVISFVLILITVNICLTPLKNLTQVASDLADGKKLDQPIDPTTQDEIGQLAEVLERLRISLDTAIKRIRRKK